MKRPRIALIHAVHPAIAPIRAAFAADWPEAEAISLLDDSLSIDRAKDAGVTPAMMQRLHHPPGCRRDPVHLLGVRPGH
jgi:hypothetical protein